MQTRLRQMSDSYSKRVESAIPCGVDGRGRGRCQIFGDATRPNPGEMYVRRGAGTGSVPVSGRYAIERLMHSKQWIGKGAVEGEKMAWWWRTALLRGKSWCACLAGGKGSGQGLERSVGEMSASPKGPRHDHGCTVVSRSELYK